LLLFLIAPLALAQETGRVYRVPFHSVNSMILLDVTVNGNPAVMLLDTGANNSIVTPAAAGLRANLAPLKRNSGAGASGDYTEAVIALCLDKHCWLNRDVLAMDLSEANKNAGARLDGFIGQDILREFSAVRIDYKAGVIEFRK
jgi:hypothetical protein